MDSFNILLNQCMELAEKLSKKETVDEDYLKDVDIFQNNFFQLQQVIDNHGYNSENNEKVKELVNMILVSKNKIMAKINNINSEINSIKNNKNTVNYGTKDPQGTHRINRRY